MTSGHMVLSGVPWKKFPVTPPGIDPGTSRLVALSTTPPQGRYASVGVSLSHAQRHRAKRYNVIASNSRFSQLRVGVALTGLRDRRYGHRISVGARDFPLLENVKTGPSTLLFGGYLGSFLRVMRPRCEGNHSPPSSAEVKNEWSYTSISPYLPSCRGQ